MSDGDGYAANRGTVGITCYSGGEDGFMKGSQRLRARFLKPLLGRLARLGLRADHLTLLGLVTGLAFCPLLLLGQPGWALVALAAHVLLDGLDGPLARYWRQASDRGSFTDTMADQIVVTAATLAMVQAGHASVWPAGLYAFFYLLVVVFAFVRNALRAPYSWLFRPRFLVFAWFAVELYFWPGTLDCVLWLCTAILVAKAATGFVKIRRRM